ncbi:prophage repressor CohE [Chitiniphilus shinanonensis]|uniref:Prophage repressor CohE n=1 Tax=Chitiniphilus shinanonensis TaxID=553088 RepID=A0ABQ6BQW5_9NEIS|nr:S24 family peptidase [Chitiniphilus shinanonensis]GLS03852.1 prophage repressor CohE [Chitiniphilus shinanonensis]
MNLYDTRRQRLQELLDTDPRFGGKSARLAAALGRQSSYLYRLLKAKGKERKNLGEGLAREFEAKLNLPYGWFDQGGPGYTHETLAEYRVGNTGELAQRWVPLVDWEQAAAMSEGEAPPDTTERLACPTECSARAFALRNVGDAMMPDYRDAELLFVDPAVTAQHGDDVVVTLGEVTMFKRLHITPEGNFLLTLNPAFPDRVLRMPEHAVLRGTVIGSWTARHPR